MPVWEAITVWLPISTLWATWMRLSNFAPLRTMVAPIVALPDNGWLVTESEKVNLGNHGFDPENSDLYVPFRAEGPDFKRGYVRQMLFDNTCIYPLLAYLLGIEPAFCDGDISQISDLLAR